MRIFTRYILREVIAYSLLGGVLFTFILFMRYLLPLMELAVRGIATPADIVRLIGYLLPGFLTLTIPMAVLVGILLGLSRLAADSEITAMRASGLGIMGFLRIVSIFSVTCWAGGLFNSLYVAPRAAQALLDYEELSKTSQATVQVEPRVFYADLKNFVLYVQDTLPGMDGSAIWRNVFLADLSKPDNPHIITSREAMVTSDGPHALRLELNNGSRHDIAVNNPAEYDISTFLDTEMPVQTGQQEDSHISRLDTPIQALTMRELIDHIKARDRDTRLYTIELHRRFAFPTACLVLMLVGVPLGMSSRRGGKGAGFVVTLGLVFAYYFVWIIGLGLARQNKIPAVLGIWGANIVFAAAGLLLIQQMSSGGAALDFAARTGTRFAQFFERIARRRREPAHNGHIGGFNMRWLRQALRINFPLILDEYVMGSFLRNFVLVLTTFTVLFQIFTFFELIGDIVKYKTPLVTVGAYLFNLIPFILYNVTPLCSLIAVLITFGSLSRSSELTAMKATGMSLYRIIAPVLLLTAIIAAALFAFDEGILPSANRRQEALLSTIKSRPAQTFLRSGRQWMSGQAGDQAEPTRIFYYQYFNPDKDAFANLTVFEFQPGSFALTRRIFAEGAHWNDRANRWDFENGWERTFNGEAVAGYKPFTLSTFPEIHEQPSYFKKEVRQSQEMNYSELSSYISDLRQSGFDTVRLRVQLNRKIAYPLVTLILALVAVPLSLTAGKRGSVAGMGAAVGVAIAFWVVAAIFENLGDVNSLPAVLAAWSPDVLFAIAGSYLLLRTPT
ncbi:LPS export ABC transporter permease LptF/LPS export ABC transporter permease LptG,TIGR04408 [Bryocella elongata]|uniref:LPS export ABC transporter permease LptF/LPS export ABC transporter permease LptG,TIGR04408 n=1 Tax=Bryocella elongata TaxID=863522 RepID=A0A1H5ZLP6_9BACT|nr:LptF/LptG family permease [Bryocella elongata]SEG37349.1 LPS export ABC transporter permease LptF/LPS export ABC transporter permease LptG,TIGR04408 [Bryocella elongata]